MYVAYNKPAAVYLGACSSGLKNTSCGAVAWDTKAGSGDRLTDLTPFITVTQACGDGTGSSGQVRSWLMWNMLGCLCVELCNHTAAAGYHQLRDKGECHVWDPHIAQVVACIHQLICNDHLHKGGA